MHSGNSLRVSALCLFLVGATALVAAGSTRAQTEKQPTARTAAEAGASVTPTPSGQQIPLPETAAGRCALAFVEAFNSGDDQRTRDFEARYRAASALASRSIEDRVDQLRQMRADLGTLTIRRMSSTGPTEVSVQVLASAKKEEWSLSFLFEDQAPHGLIGIRVTPAASGPGNELEKPVDDNLRKDTVVQLADTLRAVYVYPVIGQRMAQMLLAKESSGGYAGVVDASDLAQRWTADLLAVCKDPHLSVEPYPSVRMTRAAVCGSRMTLGGAGADDFGFRKSEVLSGNIGYIQIDRLDGQPEARDAASKALASVSECSALILDLRANMGGSPKMIQFICSYLFDRPTHLNSFLDRQGRTAAETWTLGTIPGRRFSASVPVYVLTSGSTFSAAEEFAYDLQSLGRATIVGAATGGGAHLVTDRVINERFKLRVPYQRAFNPVTKANWEGTGVQPDIRVPQADALAAAVKDAAAKAAARK